jgi:hypothetical protein
MKGVENDDMSFQIGLTHILVVGLVSLYLLSKTVRLKSKVFKKNHIILALGTLCLFAVLILLVLQNPFTLWLWKNIPGLKIIDIPWRLLGLTVFLASLLSAFLVYQVKSKILIFILLFFIFYSNRNHLRINKTVSFDDEFFLNYLDTATWQNEFLPIWRKTNKWQNLEKDYYLENQDNINVDLLQSKTTNLKFLLEVKDKSKITINRLYFPGWTYYLNGKELKFDEGYKISESIEIETETEAYKDRSGFPVIEIPEGEHQLSAEFRSTSLRKLGYFLSLFGFFLSITGIAIPGMFDKLLNNTEKL